MQARPTATPRARLQGGNLYLARELCDQYLAKVSCVALVKEKAELWLVPLQTVGGGQLLKQRNARGDRVLHLQAFLRDNALNENTAADCPVRWDVNRASLAITLPDELQEEI